MASDPNSGVDPSTGLYSYGTPSFSPGPSSPATGGLISLLNALQGVQNRQQTMAAQKQAEEEQIFKTAEAGGEGMFPSEAATTLQVPAGRQSEIVSSTPRAKFQAGLSAWREANPGKDPSPDQIAAIQMEATGQVPTGAYGLYGREAAAGPRWQGNEAKQVIAANEIARKTMQKYWSEGAGKVTADDARAAGYQAALPSLAGVRPEVLQNFKDMVAAMDPTNIGVSEKAKLTAAQTSTTLARGEYIKAIQGPEAQLKAAQAGLDNVRSQILQLNKAAGAKGTTPAQLTMMMSRLVGIEKQLKAEEGAMAMPGQEQSHADAIATYKGALEDVKAQITAAKAAATTPTPTPGATPKPKGPYVPGQTYKNKTTNKTAVADENGYLPG